jgi:alkylhydroperoxidase/carboxymuconolactone decarboxylase family protein YurZ
MRQETYRDGAVAAKYKLLVAMTISIAIRYEPCIRPYVRMAYSKGVSREELIEFLDLAMTMQGCPGEEMGPQSIRSLYRLSWWWGDRRSV